MPPTDHPEYAALLRAICADPDDDTPRLVCADWLEEHGDADRAAFIRVQVELARLESSGLGKTLEADELRKRERSVLGPYSYSWRLWAAEACPQLVRVVPGERGKPLESMRVEGAERLTFRRGFVEAVRCNAETWYQHGGAVRERQPVRQVVLEECEGGRWPEWYAMIPTLLGLRRLHLRQSRLARDGLDGLRGWLVARLPGVEVAEV